MANSPTLTRGEIGSLADDDPAFPGLGVRFEQRLPTYAAQRDWDRDAEDQARRIPYLLEDETDPFIVRPAQAGYVVLKRTGEPVAWFETYKQADMRRHQLCLGFIGP